MSKKVYLRRVASWLASILQRKENGHIFLVGMVRNELDIVETWAEHLNAVFDHIIIYGHLSSDGTREKLIALAAKNSKLQVGFFDDLALDQSGLMTRALQEVQKTTTKGWVFFVDADVFIATPSQTSFRKTLERHRAARTIILRWQNAYPLEQDKFSKRSLLSGWAQGPGSVHKVAVNLRYAAEVSKVFQGNQSVEMTPNGISGIYCCLHCFIFRSGPINS